MPPFPTASTPLPPWLQPIYQQICTGYCERFPHALLLTGSAGNGKQLLAAKIAQRLLCHHPNGSKPCGICRACKLHQYHTHPDLSYLSTTLENPTLQVHQIHQLVQNLQMHSHLGRARVIIIAPAEAMNHYAANALLKTLEEPGINTCFILVNHRLDQLLPTIRSRCILVHCPLPSPAAAMQWIIDQTPQPLNQQRIATMLTLAGGAPLNALKELQEDAASTIVLDGLQAVMTRKEDILTIAERWYPLRLSDLLAWQNILIAQLLRCHYGVAVENCCWPQFDQLQKNFDPQSALALGALLHTAQREIAHHRPNASLLIDQCLMQWQQIWC